MKVRGETIRRRRETLGWTQTRLARELGTSQPYISKLERIGLRNPEIGTLDRLARVLGVRPTELLGIPDSGGRSTKVAS